MNGQVFLWTSLIGFDRDLPDRGVREYLDKLGYRPDGVSLFLFNADIVHLHRKGMEEEIRLPISNCNYYGAIRNEIRDTQLWTNHQVRELCRELHGHGIKVLLGIMGVAYPAPPSRESDSFLPRLDGHQVWVGEHPELRTGSSLNVLKRFADGSYYENYLATKLAEVLDDYEMDGVHMADHIMPQGASPLTIDCSDDMAGQFQDYSGIRLPEEFARSLDEEGGEAIGKRREYIWNHHRMAWLRFHAWRWERFVKTICDRLHPEGQLVTGNSFWCTDAFEAYYRYGVDYKALYRAGLDYLMLEDQATSVYMFSTNERDYNMQKYNLMPLMVRAFAPEGGLLGFSAVKDSTEEWSVITHFPASLEREIYSLPNTFVQGEDGLRRSLDGFLVCLADGLTKIEWSWWRQRSRIAFAEVPERVLTPLMVWSDSLVYDFAEEYCKTRRWSHYKQLYEFGQAGSRIVGAVRVDNLDSAIGALFVPNVDVFPLEEQERIAAYRNGPIVCTSLAGLSSSLPGRGTADFYMEDPLAECKLSLFAYGVGDVDADAICATLGEDDGSADIEGDPLFAPEPGHFTLEMVYRKVSSGFVCACARLLRLLYETPVDAACEDIVAPFAMGGNRFRLLLANDNKLQYHHPTIRSERRVRDVETHSEFPALPPKLIRSDGAVGVPRDKRVYEECEITGFIHKIPPHGATFVDVRLDPPGDDAR